MVKMGKTNCVDSISGESLSVESLSIIQVHQGTDVGRSIIGIEKSILVREYPEWRTDVFQGDWGE